MPSKVPPKGTPEYDAYRAGRRAYEKLWNAGNTKRYEANRKWKRKQLNAYELAKDLFCCAFCSESVPGCLDFHHLDPSKKEFSVGNAKGTHSLERLMAEIQKCVVVCKNCHVKVHLGILTIGPAELQNTAELHQKIAGMAEMAMHLPRKED